MTYDWLAAFVFFVLVMAGLIGTRRFLFRVPEFESLRLQNRDVDGVKLSKDSYRDAVKINMRAGMYTNYAFYVLVLPWSISFAAKPVWLFLVEIVAILALFDFLYYWTHRSLFHGSFKGNPLRKIHALHHQARTPTYIDSQFVHPVETIIGLLLFL